MKFNFLKRRNRQSGSYQGDAVAPPKPVNDNLYLAAATQAAAADKASGAYDEFLFNDDSITRMPFEDALDSHARLLSFRIAEALRKSVLLAASKEVRAESKVEIAKARVRKLVNEISENETALDREKLILKGDILGDHDVKWVAPEPEYTSLVGAIAQLSLPWLIFIFVGAADLGIFIYSLGAVFPDGAREVVLFAVPAVGIQVGFPHLVGHRLAWLMRGSTRRAVDLGEIFTLGLSWITFCFTLTFVRMNFVRASSESVAKSNLLSYFLFAMTLLMILGLGALLIFTSARRNPHQMMTIRLNLRSAKLKSRLRKASEIEVRDACDWEISKKELERANDDFAASVDSSSLLLAASASSVYRRALVNSMGSTDFTSAYLVAGPSSNRIGD